MNNQYTTPILLVVFNRENTTKQVFTTLRELKPLNLFIASDGARTDKEGEDRKVKNIRDYLINNIDWECNLRTNFRDQNLGCGPGVKASIDWFFSEVESGIILEDDIICDTSFFSYSAELLEKYQNDTRVGMISGNNHIGFSPENGDSYIFSKFMFTWGWATWKRSWENMDIDMNWLNSPYKDSIIENMGYSKKSVKHWLMNLELIEDKIVSAWDYQWFFSLSTQNQLCIFPKKNLCANIGFGEDGTHCVVEAPEKFTNKFSIDTELIHPKYVVVNSDFERQYEKEMIYLKPLWKRILPKTFKNVIKSVLGRK